MRWIYTLPLSLCMFVAVPALAQEQAPSATEPVKTQRVFEITRDGNKIGTDIIEIDKVGDTTTLKSKTHISVKVAFIEAYHFDHSHTEVWTKGHFVSYKGHTDDNGTKYEVFAKVAGTKFDVTVNGEKSELPEVVLPATLWNAGFVDATQLLDTDKGKVMSVAVKDMGDDTIDMSGTEVHAHHYSITGDFNRDVWLEDGVPVRIKLYGSDHSLIISDLQR
ncbi:MAG: DUF6134 family protein [Methylovirgula sp.]